MKSTQIRRDVGRAIRLGKLAASGSKTPDEQIREPVRHDLNLKAPALPSLSELGPGFDPLPEADGGLKPHDRWVAEAIRRSKSSV
jgi:hypothetical protein